MGPHEGLAVAAGPSGLAPRAVSVAVSAPMSWPSGSWRLWPSHGVAQAASVGLKGFPCGGQRLGDKTVAVLGTGAVGGVALNHLARVGVGTLIAVDPDSYEADSWLTQPALPSDAGQKKAWLQAERAHQVNPSITVLGCAGIAQDVPLALLRKADLLLVAGDNLDLLVWAGEMGAALGKPVIQGAVHGETATAFVRAFDRTDPQSVCPGCGVSAREWALTGNRLGCDLKPSLNPQLNPQQQPTRTLPTICATAGVLAASEAVKRLAGVAKHALRDEELSYSLLGHKLMRTSLPRNPACRGLHERWKLVDAKESGMLSASATPSEVVGHCQGEKCAEPPRGLEVRSELPWVSAAQCGDCGLVQRVARFTPLAGEVGRCSCGGSLRGDRAGSFSVIPRAELEQCWNRTLAELGVPAGAAVGVAVDGHWSYFFTAHAGLAELVGGQLPSVSESNLRSL